MKTGMLIALAMMAGAAPAYAQKVQANDPASIIRVLQANDYPATLGKDREGDPQISSEYEGTAFKVLFYNCTEGTDCRTVQLHSGYDLKEAVPLTTINAWNASQRFGRAYLDDEGDPILQMDIDLDDGGMSVPLFEDNLEFWTSVLSRFENHIGYDK